MVRGMFAGGKAGGDPSQKATDWEITSFPNLSGGAGLAGGLYFFGIRSLSIPYNMTFTFVGLGIGAGGASSLSVGPEPEYECVEGWSSLRPEQPFSGWDLNNALGRVSQGSAGLSILGKLGFGPGFGAVVVSAYSPFGIGTLFHSVELYGGSMGQSGLAALSTVGTWVYTGTPENLKGWKEPACEN